MQIETPIQGITGPTTDGPTQPLRAGRTRQLMVAQAQARFYDMVKNGSVYVASNTAAQALSLNSGTATGLILSNPAASGKDLILLEVCVALASAPAGAAPLILTGSTGSVTHTTPLTPANAYLNGGAAQNVGLADSAATITAPSIRRAIGGGPVAASLIAPAFIKDVIDGALVIAPGQNISLQCLTTAISVVASFTWMEVPV